MVERGIFLTLWIVLSSVWFVVHIALLRQTLRSETVPTRFQWVAWIPVCTPLVAWAGNHRWLPIVWSMLALSYLVLRLWPIV